jgi:hypothetical protein
MNATPSVCVCVCVCVHEIQYATQRTSHPIGDFKLLSDCPTFLASQTCSG